MRLFTGLALAPNVLDKLSTILTELQPTAAINWSPIQNLHITIKFIGQWPEERLPELKTALSDIPPANPVKINVARFGFFPNPHRPHSFFAAVQASPALSELAAEIDRALAPLGITPEDRSYHPHITLARIKGLADLRLLREHIATMTDFDFGSFTASQFHLYQSQPSAGKSVYSKLATYDLIRETLRTS